MKNRLRKLMKAEGLNSTRLAEILEIQASGISHIMSGRNKPSYDFIVKILSRFPSVNPEWLLLEKGPMYREQAKTKSAVSAVPDDLFAESSVAAVSKSDEPDNIDMIPAEVNDEISAFAGLPGGDLSEADTVIVCYRDNSCKVYKVRR